MAKPPRKKIDFTEENFTFELVLAERDYKGEPTGRMKSSFKTDSIDKLSAHYMRNRGISRKKKRKKSGVTDAKDAEKILNEINKNTPENIPENNDKNDSLK